MGNFFFFFLYSYLEKKRSTTSDVGSKVQSIARSRGAMDFARLSFFGDRKGSSSYCRLVNWIESNENRKRFLFSSTESHHIHLLLQALGRRKKVNLQEVLLVTAVLKDLGFTR